jgi:hypothetical protein
MFPGCHFSGCGHISTSEGTKIQGIKGENMDPAVIMVIRTNGIEVIRLVASTPKEERLAMDLYCSIQRPINDIRKIIRSGNRTAAKPNG